MIGLFQVQSMRELEYAKPIIENIGHLEKAGFDSLFVPDHHLNTFDESYLNPVVFLASMASRTKTMTLGQAVLLVPFYHPILLAEQMATLDQVSGGRAVLGAGVGWEPSEFRAFGLEHASRFRLFKESIELLRRFWSQSSVTFEGEFFNLDDVQTGVKPVRNAGIPIYMAGIAEKALERVARSGDGWIPSLWASFEEIANGIETIKGHLLDSHGKGTMNVVVNRVTIVSKTREAAVATARRALREHVGRRADWRHPIAQLLDDGKGQVPLDALTSRIICGDVADVAEQIRTLRRVGVGQINLRLSFDGMTDGEIDENISLATTEVLPHVL